MDADEAATPGMKPATDPCSRLYNFFASHFASQSTKLVTLGGPRGSGPAETPRRVEAPDAAKNLSPAANAPVEWRTIPIVSAETKLDNINERSEAYIRTRKEMILQSDKTGGNPPP